jgi:translocation and assembly module TamB
MLYLMQSEAGLRWLIGKATDAVPGLSITSSEGRLSGPMKIKGIRYTSGQSSVGIDEIMLDWKLSRLVFLTAHISSLNAEGITIVTAGETEASEPAAGLPEVDIPLKIVLNKAVISNISIRQKNQQKSIDIHVVSLKGHMDSDRARIQHLDITMPELDLRAQGHVSPRGDYPLSFTTSWNARVPGYEAISGRGDISGSMKQLTVNQEITSPVYGNASIKINDVIENLNWEGNLSVQEFNMLKLNRAWPDLTFSGDVRGHGSKTKADISSLTVRVLDGTVAGRGSVGWDPYVSWDVDIHSDSLNPGIQWPEWQGSIDLLLRSTGRYEKEILTVKRSQVSVNGRLRNRRFKAEADVSAVDSHMTLSRLDIRSGESSVSASGTVADTLSLIWKADIRDAGDVIPKGRGVIEGSGSVTGSRISPVIKGMITGNAVAFGDYGAEVITATVDIDTQDKRESLLHMKAVNVLAEGQKINTVSLKGTGVTSAHSLSMDAAMLEKNMVFSLTGKYADRAWTGRLNRSVIDAGMFGTWSLREPASLSASKDRAGVESLCMNRDNSDICLQAAWDRADGIKGEFSITDFPLKTINSMFPASVETEGSIGGNGRLSYTPKGTMSGNFSLVMESGKLLYRANGEPIDISIGKSQVDVVLDEKTLNANAEITLHERGQLKGGISLPGFVLGKTAPSDQHIMGQMSAELNNLDLIPVFIKQVSSAKGSLAAQFTVTGRLAETAVAGDLTVLEGAVDIPDLGLKIRDVNASVKADKSGVLAVKGRLSSGSGQATVQGTVGLHKDKTPSAAVRIEGENFEAIKIPGAWVMVSPDIQVRIENRMVDFSGSLKIPQASIEPPDLSGALVPSKDVIIVDDPAREKEAGWSVLGTLALTLGDDVRFTGYGLSCRVAGGINLTEEPGKVTMGQGELQIVEGKYKAYGQELTIDKGRLIFAGPLDNPGLDIKAFRKVQDVTAGVTVEGRLKTPGFRVYSVPAMDEADALSYVLFGRPMGRLSGSEGTLLYQAALSAGLSSGGFALKKIGAAFGIEDIDIATDEDSGEATVFIGRYLSPKLYISYGIGLFEPVSTVRLRFNLTRRFLIQTEHGLESGGDVLYTIER